MILLMYLLVSKFRFWVSFAIAPSRSLPQSVYHEMFDKAIDSDMFFSIFLFLALQ